MLFDYPGKRLTCAEQNGSRTTWGVGGLFQAHVLIGKFTQKTMVSGEDFPLNQSIEMYICNTLLCTKKMLCVQNGDKCSMSNGPAQAQARQTRRHKRSRNR